MSISISKIIPHERLRNGGVIRVISSTSDVGQAMRSERSAPYGSFTTLLLLLYWTRQARPLLR
ncbi:hypothetical protein [Paenibacillus curdlanolyticus]|uniref:hypothetical protein n=1 Tax=Paenibacillus curdlanolyticus TaxID=59840 RepID=UPI000304F8B4|nr:hypothetical protein [Paenibacillus curdlanolyticus]